MELLKFLSTFYYIFRIYFFHHLKIFILFLFFKKIIRKVKCFQYYKIILPIKIVKKMINYFKKKGSKINRYLLIIICNSNYSIVHKYYCSIATFETYCMLLISSLNCNMIVRSLNSKVLCLH